MGGGSCRRDPLLWGWGEEVKSSRYEIFWRNTSTRCSFYLMCILCVYQPEQIAPSSVPLSGSSSGTDEASLRWNQNCMQENVQGRRIGGQVVDAQLVIEKKGALDEYFIMDPLKSSSFSTIRQWNIPLKSGVGMSDWCYWRECLPDGGV